MTPPMGMGSSDSFSHDLVYIVETFRYEWNALTFNRSQAPAGVYMALKLDQARAVAIGGHLVPHRRIQLLRLSITDNTTRIADDYRTCRHVIEHNGAGANHGAISYSHTWQNRGIGSDRRMVFDDRLHEARRTRFGPWKAIVGEGRIWTDKDLVAKPHPVPQLNPALDRGRIAYDHVVFDKHAIADIAIPTDSRAREHVRKCPNPCPFADMRRFTDSRRVNEDGHVTCFSVTVCRCRSGPERCDKITASGRRFAFSEIRHR